MKFQVSPFPLAKTSKQDLQRLCEALWKWKICVDCKAGEIPTLHDVTCPWPSRSLKLSKFFDYYRQVVGSYVPDLLPGDEPALRNHDDLIEIIRVVKDRPEVPRGQLTKSHFSGRNTNGSKAPPVSDQNRAFDLAIKVLVMINCAVDGQSLGLLESGVVPLTWPNDESLGDFLTNVFPSANHRLLNEKDHFGRAPGTKALLTARRLKRIAGLKIEPTSDLRDHLRVDQRTGILLVYHHAAFLTENLIASKSSLQPTTVGQAIQSGNIPRQLALEALDSLQKILFPPDPDSQYLLRSLVAKSSFDPECLNVEPTLHRSDDEHDIEYRYFGSRLMDLYEEILNPRPRGLIEKWAERRSGARHVMIATLIGVLIAIFLGLLALIVSIFQAWVSYQAWKHPISST